MILARKIKDVRRFRQNLGGRSLGLVPTMGDLHAGHLSLIRRSKKENMFTVVSIFVNPAQFNQRRDFLKYHRDESRDLDLLKKEKVDLVFLPSAKEMYPQGFQTWIEVKDLAQTLCGPFRPGHFRGVATVAAKLFEIVQPGLAYFGMKDYQQLKVIERMVKDLNLPVQIVPCPTVREGDGLAMSSRNKRLSASERALAARLPFALQQAGQMIKSEKINRAQSLLRRFLRLLGVQRENVDYLQAVHPQTLQILENPKPPCVLAAAVWIGKTRLIDNLLIQR